MQAFNYFKVLIIHQSHCYLSQSIVVLSLSTHQILMNFILSINLQLALVVTAIQISMLMKDC